MTNIKGKRNEGGGKSPPPRNQQMPFPRRSREFPEKPRLKIRNGPGARTWAFLVAKMVPSVIFLAMLAFMHVWFGELILNGMAGLGVCLVACLVGCIRGRSGSSTMTGNSVDANV